ncbi:hypothetical protein WICPIJ_001130 [Wickerhamomyces pijperi]|uniref:Uncharacterized protein n=1 Tax=Wickerhamomyces pijperi TaxID=599730 RepID=A0A9P8QCB1_WICPI|nr:hypothetical protein WICPIJ_001130 [Wickerhamomyces pijperi]
MICPTPSLISKTTYSNKPTIKIVTNEDTEDNTGEVNDINDRKDKLKIKLLTTEVAISIHWNHPVGNENLETPVTWAITMTTHTKSKVHPPIIEAQKFEKDTCLLEETTSLEGQTQYL